MFIVDFWDSTSHNDYESNIEAVIMRGQDNALCMQYWRESTSGEREYLMRGERMVDSTNCWSYTLYH